MVKAIIFETPLQLTQEQRHHMSRELTKALDGVDAVEHIRLGHQPPTVRELAAIAALQGITASPSFHGPTYQGHPMAAAQFAAACADLLIDELAKATTPAREHA